MNYEEEKRRYISFCGSYCKKCPWFTGEIRDTFKRALFAFEEYGLGRLIKGRVNAGEFREALRALSMAGICSGCKAEIKERPEEDRCKIRQCAYRRGVELCSECSEFPCGMLIGHPGVIKFKCIENLIELKERGLKAWIDRQWI